MGKFILSSVLSAFIVLSANIATAAPIPGDLAITGSIDFDNSPFGAGFSQLSSATNSGDMTLMSGGVASTTTFDGLTTMGADPLAGNLTMTGDGLNVTGQSEVRSGQLAIEVLGLISGQNNSATDMYKISFEIDFSATVSASGPDAAMEVEFDVGTMMMPSSIASVEVLSDTIAGNSRTFDLGGMFLINDGMGLGGDVTLNQIATFEITLNPGETFDMTAFWSWTSFFSDSLAAGQFDVGLHISSVENLTNPDRPKDVPAPAGVGILFLGISALYLTRRRRK